MVSLTMSLHVPCLFIGVPGFVNYFWTCEHSPLGVPVFTMSSYSLAQVEWVKKKPRSNFLKMENEKTSRKDSFGAVHDHTQCT